MRLNKNVAYQESKTSSVHHLDILSKCLRRGYRPERIIVAVINKVSLAMLNSVILIYIVAKKLIVCL